MDGRVVVGHHGDGAGLDLDRVAAGRGAHGLDVAQLLAHIGPGGGVGLGRGAGDGLAVTQPLAAADLTVLVDAGDGADRASGADAGVATGDQRGAQRDRLACAVVRRRGVGGHDGDGAAVGEDVFAGALVDHALAVDQALADVGGGGGVAGLAAFGDVTAVAAAEAGNRDTVAIDAGHADDGRAHAHGLAGRAEGGGAHDDRLRGRGLGGDAFLGVGGGLPFGVEGGFIQEPDVVFRQREGGRGTLIQRQGVGVGQGTGRGARTRLRGGFGIATAAATGGQQAGAQEQGRQGGEGGGGAAGKARRGLRVGRRQMGQSFRGHDPAVRRGGAFHGEPAGDRSGPLPAGRRWAPVSEKSHTNSRDWRCVWETPADGWALPFDRGNVPREMAIYVARIVEEAYVFDEKASRPKVVGCRWVGRGGRCERLPGRGMDSRSCGMCPRPALRPMRGWRARRGSEGWVGPARRLRPVQPAGRIRRPSASRGEGRSGRVAGPWMGGRGLSSGPLPSEVVEAWAGSIRAPVSSRVPFFRSSQ